MRVFLSWSGTLSKAIATALAEWLPYVVQTAKPWMSEHDIQAGTVWERELAENLKATDCGVLILTSENQNAPWLLFEAGALSRSGNDRVIPYRVDLPLAEVAAPLTRFQGVDADLLGTKKLVAGLNAALPEPMPDKLLDGLFDVFWPKLQPELSKHISSPTRAVARRSQEDYLIEILGVLRNSKTPQSSGQSHEASPAVATRRSNRRSSRSGMQLPPWKNTNARAAARPSSHGGMGTLIAIDRRETYTQRRWPS